MKRKSMVLQKETIKIPNEKKKIERFQSKRKKNSFIQEKEAVPVIEQW